MRIALGSGKRGTGDSVNSETGIHRPQSENLFFLMQIPRLHPKDAGSACVKQIL